MKKKLIFLSVFPVLMPFCLTACESGSWNDFKNPTAFLKTVEAKYSRSSICMNDGREGSRKDYKLEIKNALNAAGPFTATEKTSSKEERFFTYSNRHHDGFVGLAAARYAWMRVYDDGFIKIEFQDTKETKYSYFTMDETKAKEVNDLVFAKIPREMEIEREDKSQAYEDGKIENFFEEMGKRSSVKVTCHETINENYYTYNFNDKGALLDMMKAVEYTRTHDMPPVNGDAFYYDGTSNSFEWSYRLYEECDFVRISYAYKNRLEDRDYVTLDYKIDPVEGRKLLNKALELGKK